MDEFCMSPEINELLKQKYAFISGGRNVTCKLLITFPDCNIEASVTDEQHKKVLKYLISAAIDQRNEADIKFSILIDGRNSKWAIVKDLLHRIFEIFPGPGMIEAIYLLQPTGFFQSLQKLLFQQIPNIDLHDKLIILSGETDLYACINPTQLTSGFGGGLYYNNDEWIKHRQLVELLHHSCVQITKDFEAACRRMSSEESDDLSAGQLEALLESMADEQRQFVHRVEKSLSEAGAEIAQLKTISGEMMSSSNLPPSSAHHVDLVERLIVEINDALSKYQTEYETRRKTLERCLKSREFEEENNKWCAILDGHLLFLVNFNPTCDTADEIKKRESELEDFVVKTEMDFCGSSEFYRAWQKFLAEDLEHFRRHDAGDQIDDSDDVISSPVNDNRIELSCLRYEELLSVYREQISLGLELHSNVLEATKWHKRGMALLSKIVPDPAKAEISTFEEALNEINLFMPSNPIKTLTDPNYSDVMTPLVKTVVDDFVVSLRNLLTSCEQRCEDLQQSMEECKQMQKPIVIAPVVSVTVEDTASTTTSEAAENKNISLVKDEVATVNTHSRSSSLTDSENSVVMRNIDKLYLSTRTNKEFSQLKPVVPTGTIKRKRGHVIQELVATERIYTTELLSIIEGYLQQFDNPEMQDLIPDDLRQKYPVLFGNMEEIYRFHSEIFLNCLENCEPTKVGKCFTDHKVKFEMYSSYCQNKMQAEYVIEQMGNYPFFKECQKRLGHRLPLHSYILKPIQRITKYHLLLRELIKMATSQEEKDELSEAVESMRDVVKYVNNILHQVSITGFDGKISEQGRLLMQGSVEVAVGRRRDKKSDARLKLHRRHVFLYEKCIIFCKRKEDAQMNEKEAYVYKNCLRTNDVGLTETPKGGDERKFEIWSQGRTDIWTIIAPNEETKDEWVKEIKRVLFNQYLHQREASRRSVIERTTGHSNVLPPSFAV